MQPFPAVSLGAVGVVWMQACHHCLKPVTNNSCHTNGGITFCSRGCHSQALQQYFGVEQMLDSAALQQHCQAHNESFPMLAMRAACQHMQQATHPSAATLKPDPEQADQPQVIPQGDIWQVQICTLVKLSSPQKKTNEALLMCTPVWLYCHMYLRKQ